ncbi:DsbA family protein [Aliikangiella sp. G2MR2-5]|uniref:DsbA family oxidoreductase n=1 Tax=Aliikangiella sp. G2MR2-5 TaxID=2788943 RepID=UPI0018AC79BB|nr:disulfide bond formation protein DsbA [Aliikangiella sp. G2MR2-5]
MSENRAPVHLSYFSDVLCIWAYLGQIRLDELKHNFGNKVAINYHHVTLFGDTETRIGLGWKKKGGFEGFTRHVLEVAEQFPHITVNPEIWKSCRPKTSAPAHLLLKAVQLLQQSGEISHQPQSDFNNKTWLEIVDWQIRHAFFHEAIDISQMGNLFEITDEFGIDNRALQQLISDGSAMALLCRDMQLKETNKLDGSPTYLLNESRQKLFGNVGYKIIEANVIELLEVGKEGQASWC